jgi:hypothetical protein
VNPGNICYVPDIVSQKAAVPFPASEEDRRSVGIFDANSLIGGYGSNLGVEGSEELFGIVPANRFVQITIRRLIKRGVDDELSHAVERPDNVVDNAERERLNIDEQGLDLALVVKQC